MFKKGKCKKMSKRTADVTFEVTSEENTIKWKFTNPINGISIGLNKPTINPEYWESRLTEIFPIILSDSRFSGSTMKLTTDKIELITKDNKIVEIPNNMDNETVGRHIVKKLSYQRLDDSTTNPISLQDIQEMKKKGIKIYKIKGEKDAYSYDDLISVLNNDGRSPTTRKHFTIDDIVEWNGDNSLDFPLPLQQTSNKVRKIESESLEETKESFQDDLSIVVLVDTSGSMSSFYTEVNVALDPLFNYIGELSEKSKISLFTFNSVVTKCFENKDKNDIKYEKLKELLKCGSTTSFYAAVSEVLESWDQIVDKDKKSIFLIITDGKDDNYNDPSYPSFIKLSTLIDNGNIWKNINCQLLHPHGVDGTEILKLSPDNCLQFDNDKEHTNNAIKGAAAIANVYSQHDSQDMPIFDSALRRASSDHYRSTIDCFDLDVGRFSSAPAPVKNNYTTQ